MSFMTKIARDINRNTNLNNATIFTRGISTSLVRHLNKKWRESMGLTSNPNTFGPLTNLPDYTFKDGRPTPYGVRQFNRINKQQEYASIVTKLVNQIDFAVDRHAKLQEEKQKKRQAILDRKLKPKGNVLLIEEDIC